MPGPSWAEDGWTAVDAGSVRTEVLMPTMRCSMPSRAQPGLRARQGDRPTLRDRHENNLGLYATIATAGTISMGDEVRAG